MGNSRRKRQSALAIRRVKDRVLEETSKGRGRTKAIASIENREREREQRWKAREGKKSKKGYRLHVNRETITRRGRAIVFGTVE